MAPRDYAGPILNGLPTNLPDIDSEETAEWLESLEAVIKHEGPERARFLIETLLSSEAGRTYLLFDAAAGDLA